MLTFFICCAGARGVYHGGVHSTFASIAQLAEHLPRKQKVTSSILVGGLMGRWSRGMILPSGGRGRGFDSRTAPLVFVFGQRMVYILWVAVQCHRLSELAQRKRVRLIT